MSCAAIVAASIAAMRRSSPSAFHEGGEICAGLWKGGGRELGAWIVDWLRDIVQCRVVYDAGHSQPVGQRFGEEASPPLCWGRRDRLDPVYENRGGLYDREAFAPP